MLFFGFVGAFKGVAVLAASCRSMMKFLCSFSMSAGSLSLVVSFMLTSISFLKRSQFALAL
jgi:hypothetical protein